MPVKRHHVDQRMSQTVCHGGLVYLAGQCGEAFADISTQTAQALQKIEDKLAEAGSAKTQILRAEIWLSDMAHFGAMNAVWDAWAPKRAAPARACGEKKLAGQGYDIEIIITATRHQGREQ